MEHSRPAEKQKPPQCTANCPVLPPANTPPHRDGIYCSAMFRSHYMPRSGHVTYKNRKNKLPSIAWTKKRKTGRARKRLLFQRRCVQSMCMTDDDFKLVSTSNLPRKAINHNTHKHVLNDRDIPIQHLKEQRKKNQTWRRNKKRLRGAVRMNP